MLRIGFGLVAVFVCLVCAGCSVPVIDLHGEFADFSKVNSLDDALWGVVARSLVNPQIFWARNEKVHFVPASNLKLFTTAAALLKLGPDYRFRTELVARGRIVNGILYGPLVVQGSGDPSLSTRFYSGGAKKIFEEWARTLVENGIREIQGDIIVDESLFDTQSLGSGWFWDDESFPYSAQISAFSTNDNCIELRISAGLKIGEPGVVETMPRTNYVTVMNRTRTDDAGLSSITVHRQAGTNNITVLGVISALESPKEILVAVHDPGLFGATVLKEVLESKGIVIDGMARTTHDSHGPERGDEQTIMTHMSPPLWTIIRQMNKSSHNLSAELLFRTLGAVCYGKGSSANGARAMQETLEGAGIVPEEIFIGDGSGLSRLSMVTPLQIVSLLEFMYHHPVFVHFYNSLPVAGEDGTLVGRMVGTCAEGNVRAKTGFLSRSGSLSGYVKKKNGNMLAFSILTNNNVHTPAEVKKIQDSFCVWLCGLQ
jgi:serine-type D-Ala-D-Ala carboxypeptidase/endopeptidase (penicillin-binding protein 4)